MQNNEKKSELNIFLTSIPKVLSSKTSIIIFLLLFVYLVVFGIIGLLPALKVLEPSNTAQLILGNYTNVLSALGAVLSLLASVLVYINMFVLIANRQQIYRQPSIVWRKKLNNCQDKLLIQSNLFARLFFILRTRINRMAAKIALTAKLASIPFIDT